MHCQVQTCSHDSHMNCQTGELFVLMNLYVIANEQCEYVGGAQQSYQQMMHSTGRRAITLVHQLPPWPLSRPRSRSSLIVVTRYQHKGRASRRRPRCRGRRRRQGPLATGAWRLAGGNARAAASMSIAADAGGLVGCCGAASDCLACTTVLC